MSAKFRDNSDQFKKNVQEAANALLAELTLDILRLATAQVPQKKSILQGSGLRESGKQRNGVYQVKYNAPYALYQHEGQRRDGTHQVRNYSNPNAKKHFLIDPAKLVLSRATPKIKAFLNGVRV